MYWELSNHEIEELLAALIRRGTVDASGERVRGDAHAEAFLEGVKVGMAFAEELHTMRMNKVDEK